MQHPSLALAVWVWPWTRVCHCCNSPLCVMEHSYLHSSLCTASVYSSRLLVSINSGMLVSCLKILHIISCPLLLFPPNRFGKLYFLPVCRNQMDRDLVRVAQWSSWDSVIGTAYCSEVVIQNVLLSGGTFNKLSVFGEFICEISFVKVTKDNNKRVWVYATTHSICSARVHCAFCTLACGGI